MMQAGMEGQLREQPLAELISEILEKRLSGALRAERERVKAVAYFEAGALVYATSNLRNLRLSEYLKKREVSTEKLDSSSDFALAESVVARGLMTKASLDEVITEQVTDVARLLLLWLNGHWSFDERARLTEPVRLEIPLKRLLFEAAKRMDPSFATARLEADEVITRGSSSPNEFSLSVNEGFLLSRVDAPTKLSELVSVSGLPELDALRAIYGFVLAGLLQKQTSTSMLITSEAKAAEARSVPVAKKKPKPPPAPSTRDPKDVVIEFLEQFDRANTHYEVLNIGQSCSASEAKQAYYDLARRFHPDRFYGLVGTDLHARLESAFARIAQAHEVLSRPESKATYDTRIAAMNKAGQMSSTSSYGASRSTPTVSTTAPRSNLQVAEQRFKEGVAALELGETNTATACLSAAARMAPDEPRYRAYYGRALAAHPQTRRLAEGELQAAIKLEPSNASYRVILATLYRDLGFWRRAISELERALSLDSRNVEARQMLESLETKK
jgi:curved DNA-binding protein CbpA